MSFRAGGVLALVFCAATAYGAAALDEARDLRAAARAGELQRVEALLASGVPVDAADEWGITPLLFAAEHGHAAVVARLLEAGADPDLRETFFGSGPLGRALRGDHVEVVRLLLAAGASDRAEALEYALTAGHLELARAAAAAGPVLESERAALVARHADAPAELAAVLAALETRPDPPPPAYTADELAAFAGRFEGWTTDTTAEVAVREGVLAMSVDGGAPTALTPVADKAFRTGDGRRIGFWGRARTVEGVSIAGEDGGATTLRRSVGEPVASPGSPRAHRADAPRRDAPAATSPHWPGFRGPGAAGVADGQDLPLTWDLEGGDGVRWKAELPGLGNSSPVVWGDRVFVTTAVGGQEGIRTGLTGASDEIDDSLEHRWLVLAYEKQSGEIAWTREVGRGVPLTHRHFKATQANSTPATDGEHLVVVFPTAGLACLGLDGELHWKHELGGLNAGGFNDPGMEWGFASSPVIYRDRVILQVDIHDGAYLAAWDLETGEPLWRTERPDVYPSWATPALWSTPSGVQVVTNASTIHGYDPADGRELWSLGPSSVQVVATPVVGDEAVYVGAGYPPAKPIYAVRPGIEGRVEVERGGSEPSLLWNAPMGGAYMPTPLLYEGLLYIVHHNGRIVAYDAATGDVVYKARFSRGGTFTSSPIAADGRIYTGTEEGLLYVLAAGAEYEELAVHDLGEPLMATPALSGGLLLVRTPSRLVAVGNPEKEATAEP